MKPTLPIDRNKRFDRDDYPATPKAYEPLDHFVQRYHNSRRFLDKELDGIEAVRRIITHGKLRDNSDGCGCFVLKWYGVEYYLVAGFHEKGYRIAVSGWPINRDRQKAVESGRWTQEELDAIDAMNNDHFEDSFGNEYDEYIEWSKANKDGGNPIPNA